MEFNVWQHGNFVTNIEADTEEEAIEMLKRGGFRSSNIRLTEI